MPNGSNIAKHVCSFEQRIAFDNSSVIDKGSFRNRKTLEVTKRGLSRRTLAILGVSSDTGIAFLFGYWAFVIVESNTVLYHQW